ncbi:MAG: FHA domain-containing protein [Planctomycetota bacterium]
MTEIKVLDKVYTLPEGITVVGRGEDADIRIDSTKLSRLHARFTVGGASIEIEDLDSKNGTFVNGARITAKRALVQGDAVRFADLECAVVFPGTPAAPAATPAPVTPAPAATASPRPRSTAQSGETVKRIASAAIIIGILVAGYMWYANYEPQGLKDARALITDMQARVDGAVVTDDMALNTEALAVLRDCAARLRSVPREYAVEAGQADALLKKIDTRAAALDARNKELDRAGRVAQALVVLDGTAAGFDRGELDLETALKQMEAVATAHAGDAAGVQAQTLMQRIRDQVLARERAAVAQARARAMALAEAGRFKEGLDAVDTCLGTRFAVLPATERDALAADRELITGQALKAFQTAADEAVATTATGDCEAIKARLAGEMARMGMSGLDGVFGAAAARIDAIRTERLAAARAKLAKELAAADALEARRSYAQAAARYEAIMAATTEDELKKEVRQKRDCARLLQAAKKLVIEYINKQGGLEQEGIGSIRKAGDESLDLVMGEESLPIGWEKIRDDEFQALLGKTLADNPGAKGLAAYGYLLLRRGNEEQAGVYLTRALNQSASIAAEYPDLFGPAMERIRKASEEAAAAAAAARTAAAAKSFPRTTSAKAATAIPTFHCLGLYWSPEEGEAAKSVHVAFREAGRKQWQDGLPMRYNPVKAPECRADYRGSIVNLKPGTTYEIVLTLDGTDIRTTLSTATWSELFPVNSTVKCDSRGTGLNINRSGTPDGYALFDGTGAVIDTANKSDHCITVDGSYLIIRGFTLRNAKLHGIRIMNASHHIVIENCDISKWGSEDEKGFGVDCQAAVFSDNSEMHSIVIQRCKLHSPSWDTNSWAEDHHNNRHPEGPQGIVFWESAGNHVFRYNEIWSDPDHYYNDVLGYGRNSSFTGFPGADTDIYGNYLANCWDDGIEVEGGGQNVRIWNNYLENTMMTFGNASVSIGPLFVWRNVSGRSYSPPGSKWDLSHGFLFKMGHAVSDSWMTGHQYIFNNTIFQPDGEGADGLGGCSRPIKHCTTRNNILQVRTGDTHSISTESVISVDNDFDYDLVTGRYPAGQEKHVINGIPKYVPGAGFVFETKTGNFQLAPGSPGYDKALAIPNFCDVFTGDAPDVGAQEAGTGPVVYGVKAEFVPPGTAGAAARQ